MCTNLEVNYDLSSLTFYRVQVNVPAESGEMGILAQHVPSIEQLKPGLIEIIEESGSNKQFFCTDFWTINTVYN